MNLRLILAALLLVLFLQAEPSPSPPGALPILVLPPRPDSIPKYTELDPTTGLHMTGTPQFLNAATWHLQVTGRVAHPLSLTYDELRRLPRLSSHDPLTCRGYFEDYANWTGAALTAVLDRAGVQSRAKSLELLSADGYSTQVTLEEARMGNAFLAYEWEGKALPELHGYPVRAVFPGSPGHDWVKWLVEIRVQ